MYFNLLQRATIALFSITLALFLGLKFYTARMVDRTPPVISFPSDVVEVSVGATEDALLADVTASDDRDGDLTGQVMVKGVSRLISANSAKVTYIAFDSSNNMSTASRTVRYTDYEKPRFSLTQPLIFPTGGQVTILDRLTAWDVMDGDISDSIRVTTQNVDLSKAGIYCVTVQVTNRLGDVESLPLRLIMTDSAQPELSVHLSDYVVYLPEGSTFDPAAYITAPASPDAVRVESAVDTNRPGIYDVTYIHQGDTVCQAVVIR